MKYYTMGSNADRYNMCCKIINNDEPYQVEFLLNSPFKKKPSPIGDFLYLISSIFEKGIRSGSPVFSEKAFSILKPTLSRVNFP